MEAPTPATECWWRVHLAQHIPPPPSPSPRCRHSPYGYWICSQSLCSLCVSKLTGLISLILGGKIFEEHPVSNLTFARPVTRKGCRMLLACYMISGKKNKFAMRFETDADAIACANILQEIYATFSSQSNSKVHLIDAAPDEATLPCPKRQKQRELQSIYQSEQADTASQVHSMQNISDRNVVDKPVGGKTVDSYNAISMPPRFQDLLASDPPEDDLGPLLRLANGDSTSSVIQTAQQKELSGAEVSGLKREIVTYLLDPSFQTLLKNVVEVWQEMQESLSNDIMAMLSK